MAVVSLTAYVDVYLIIRRYMLDFGFELNAPKVLGMNSQGV